MDPASLKAFIRLISKEKDLEPDVIKEAIERSILTASRKNLSQYRDAVANLNMDTGELTVHVAKNVVENDVEPARTEIRVREARKILKNKKIKAGEEVIVPIEPSEFGRIAAQSARQIVMQHLRDAEREKIFKEYKDKVGQVVTGIVQRFERRDVIMNIGRTEGILPLNEQPQGSKYRFNDRLKVMIIRVEPTSRGPMIVLSRKVPELLIELFRQEVPELVDGTVQIVGIAREAGVRTKIAVKSTNPDVDPVGACVGMKGSRVQMVVRELENEKIDIVPWSSEHKTFISNALNPAKIVSIDVDEATKSADVIVAQGNLAIAIGRKGQNTKLAAKLSGYRLNIRSENEEELAYEEIQRRYLEDFLEQIGGLSELAVQALLRSNFNSVEKLSNVDPDRLLPYTGNDLENAQRLIGGAAEYLEALRQMEEERRAQREDAGAEASETPEGADGATEGAAESTGESEEESEESEEEGGESPELESESEETAAEGEEEAESEEEDEEEEAEEAEAESPTEAETK
jgi:N utilization substance protein A